MKQINLTAPEVQDNQQPEKAPEALAFPIERLPGAAQDVAREIARTRLLPTDLPGSLALVTAAAAIGKGLVMDIPPPYHPRKHLPTCYRPQRHRQIRLLSRHHRAACYR